MGASEELFTAILSTACGKLPKRRALWGGIKVRLSLTLRFVVPASSCCTGSTAHFLRIAPHTSVITLSSPWCPNFVAIRILTLTSYDVIVTLYKKAFQLDP
jgi:hypothetical protein